LYRDAGAHVVRRYLSYAGLCDKIVVHQSGRSDSPLSNFPVQLADARG